MTLGTARHGSERPEQFDDGARMLSQLLFEPPSDAELRREEIEHRRKMRDARPSQRLGGATD